MGHLSGRVRAGRKTGMRRAAPGLLALASALSFGAFAMIYFGLALVAICASIPWPGLPVGRPLFRF